MSESKPVEVFGIRGRFTKEHFSFGSFPGNPPSYDIYTCLKCLGTFKEMCDGINLDEDGLYKSVKRHIELCEMITK